MSSDQAAGRPLFQPLTIRNLTLRNRVVMAPMTRLFAKDGVIDEGVVDYYRRRAENDVGLIVTEGLGVDHPSAIGRGSMGEETIPLLRGGESLARWRKVVDAVHAAGGAIFPQLWHQGVVRQPGTGLTPDAPPMRPSGIWGPFDGLMSVLPDYLEGVREPTSPMTDEDIADAIAAFARSAADARDAGFDGIAIHGAHGYLVDSFFWHETNLRTDRWGGALIRERARFGTELIKAIRAEVGDLPIMFRYSQWKLQDYNGKLADNPEALEQLLGPLADAGVDVFDASTRHFHMPAFAGSDLTLAGWTKKLSGKPTAAVGGIGLTKEMRNSFETEVAATNNIAEVEARIASGEFDLAGVGRSLLADPAWVHKVRDGLPFAPFNPESISVLY